MAIHHLRPVPGTLRGYLTRDLPPSWPLIQETACSTRRSTLL